MRFGRSFHNQFDSLALSERQGTIVQRFEAAILENCIERLCQENRRLPRIYYLLARRLFFHLLTADVLAVIVTGLPSLRGERLTLRDRPGDIFPFGAGGEQRTNQEVE